MPAGERTTRLQRSSEVYSLANFGMLTTEAQSSSVILGVSVVNSSSIDRSFTAGGIGE